MNEPTKQVKSENVITMHRCLIREIYDHTIKVIHNVSHVCVTDRYCCKTHV